MILSNPINPWSGRQQQAECLAKNNFVIAYTYIKRGKRSHNPLGGLNNPEGRYSPAKVTYDSHMPVAMVTPHTSIKVAKECFDW